MNKNMLNDKLDELRDVIIEMECIIACLNQNENKQVPVYNQFMNATDDFERILLENEYATLKLSEQGYRSKLFDLDKDVDGLLLAIFAQFPNGEKVLWRKAMEEKYPGMIVRFDKICDLMDDVGRND